MPALSPAPLPGAWRRSLNSTTQLGRWWGRGLARQARQVFTVAIAAAEPSQASSVGSNCINALPRHDRNGLAAGTQSSLKRRWSLPEQREALRQHRA